jgi:polyisoprenoid-binding protein YceI
MMKINTASRNMACAMFLFASAVLLAASATPPRQQAQEEKTTPKVDLLLDSKSSKVRWELGGSLHTVHGTFRATRGKVNFDPSDGKASGEIVVDAKSGESGNDSRDKKMHKDVLESAKFGEIVFLPDRVEGKVMPAGLSTIQLHGTFDIHGTKQELTIPMQVELSADHWKGSGKFKVPYAQWGMKNPSNFFLKVDSFVEVEVEMSGSVQTASHAAD